MSCVTRFSTKHAFILTSFPIFFKGRMCNFSILVISDSHGNIPALTAALGWAQQTTSLDAAIFLGDGAGDLAIASSRAGFTPPWYKVRGNGDLDLSIPAALVLEIPCQGEIDNPAMAKFFLAHGNRHGVDAGGMTIAAAAKAAGADAAFFGHTHVPYCAMVNGIFVLNPGSIRRSRFDAGPTFAVLDCPAKGPVSARFFCLVNKGRKIEVQEFEF
jgi:putative phosphoesterase